MAPGAGDHVISLVDEISYVSPPSPPLSQIDDIPPEQFCNGDNKPPNCGRNCMCTHKVDIPLNAVVEVVLVDEGKYVRNSMTTWSLIPKVNEDVERTKIILPLIVFIIVSV